MNLLSLDLELTQPTRKIIQVGACVFKSKTGEVLEKLNIYVNPKELLSEEIKTLTGITQEQVDAGTTALDAYKKVCALRLKYHCPRGIVVWGSGEYNDSSCLHRQSGAEGPNDLGYRVTDAKTLYQSMKMYDNGTIKAGLGTAMRSLGLTFIGREHDGLDDAINTAKIWVHLAKKLSNG